MTFLVLLLFGLTKEEALNKWDQYYDSLSNVKITVTKHTTVIGEQLNGDKTNRFYHAVNHAVINNEHGYYLDVDVKHDEVNLVAKQADIVNSDYAFSVDTTKDFKLRNFKWGVKHNRMADFFLLWTRLNDQLLVKELKRPQFQILSETVDGAGNTHWQFDAHNGSKFKGELVLDPNAFVLSFKGSRTDPQLKGQPKPTPGNMSVVNTFDEQGRFKSQHTDYDIFGNGKLQYTSDITAEWSQPTVDDLKLFRLTGYGVSEPVKPTEINKVIMWPAIIIVAVVVLLIVLNLCIKRK